MAARGWELEFDEVEKLEAKIKQIPQLSEKTINDVVHNQGAGLLETSIRAYIPVSQLDGVVRPKKHARDVKFPTKPDKLNLGVIVRPKPKYEYLKYPDLAIGTSKNNKPREFMATGLEKAAPKIVEDINIALDDVIKRTLGG